MFLNVFTVCLKCQILNYFMCRVKNDVSLLAKLHILAYRFIAIERRKKTPASQKPIK